MPQAVAVAMRLAMAKTLSKNSSISVLRNGSYLERFVVIVIVHCSWKIPD